MDMMLIQVNAETMAAGATFAGYRDDFGLIVSEDIALAGSNSSSDNPFVFESHNSLAVTLKWSEKDGE